GTAGADTLERHTELCRYLQDQGQADAVATWIDAQTRNHRYGEADEAVEEAERTGKVILNGFPIVHYGVTGTRKLIASIKVPAAVYANGPDLRLIAEIALAGGHTSTAIGGSLCAFWGYTSNMPPEMVMRNYQYHYRLEGCYQERGVPISVQIIGASSSNVNPSLYHTSAIIEALMAAEQGVRHFRFNPAQSISGNIAQDVAGAVTIRKLAREYLDKFGYKDSRIYVGSYHPYGKFPEDDGQAFAIIGLSPLVGVLGACDIVFLRTIDEGRQIPRKEQNASTHRYVRMLLNMLKDQKLNMLDNKAVMTEADMLEREVRAILDRVLEMGDGDVVIGSSRAMEAGVLDMTFASTQRTLSKVMAVRDAQGAVRYLDHGNLPFTSDIIEFHKEKIAERAVKEGKPVDYDTIIGDVFALSRGYFISSSSWQDEEKAKSL
ncbi:methylaspartate mutase subunit E, partial [Chloroflexota bacterium]